MKTNYFISLLFFGIAIIALSGCQKAPQTEIDLAKAAVDSAKSSGAEKYAVKDYTLTTALWDSLMVEWGRQNKKYFWRRNFSHLTGLAEMVSIHAEIATECAKNVRHDIQTAIEIDLELLDSLTKKFDYDYRNLPLNKNIYHDITRVKLLNAEGIMAFKRKEYHRASVLISECLKLAEGSEKQIIELLMAYFENYPEWEKWKSETIQWSRKSQRTAIIVDKFNHICLVYNKGILIREYKAEFGPNWIGDKNHSGDKATPEGKYQIIKKLGINETKYYKALLINYPNEDDIKRYKAAIRQGSIPAGRGIGNLIEIHGGGGQGINWTDGCVALENTDMDQLYKSVGMGTPVTIVGSLKPLNELFILD